MVTNHVVRCVLLAGIVQCLLPFATSVPFSAPTALDVNDSKMNPLHTASSHFR